MPSRALALIAGGVILALGLGSFFLFNFISDAKQKEILINLNQQTVYIPKGSKVADLLASLEASITHGDLLDIEEQLIAVGQGKKGTCRINGDLQDDDHVLKSGDEVRVERGINTIENTRLSQHLYARSPLSLNGRGPVYSVVQVGKNNEDRFRVGVISGKKQLEKAADGVVAPTQAKGLKYAGDKKIIALTFDDGPNPAATPAILDTLKTYQAKATFFTITHLVERNPEIAKRIIDEGSQIAMHSTGHKRHTQMWPDEIRFDLLDAEKRIEAITKVKPKWVRPPYGSVDGTSLSVLSELGLKIAMWDIDTRDWKMPGVPAIVSAANAGGVGSVILMHDGGVDRSQTVAALPQIIQFYKNQGYSFVTLDEYAAELGIK